MMLLKKLYDKSVTNVNTIDTTGFVFKYQHKTDKSGLGKKIDDKDRKDLVIMGLLKKQIIMQKITDESKTRSITGLASTSALNAVEKKDIQHY